VRTTGQRRRILESWCSLRDLLELYFSVRMARSSARDSRGVRGPRLLDRFAGEAGRKRACGTGHLRPRACVRRGTTIPARKHTSVQLCIRFAWYSQGSDAAHRKSRPRRSGSNPPRSPCGTPSGTPSGRHRQRALLEGGMEVLRDRLELGRRDASGGPSSRPDIHAVAR